MERKIIWQCHGKVAVILFVTLFARTVFADEGIYNDRRNIQRKLSTNDWALPTSTHRVIVNHLSEHNAYPNANSNISETITRLGLNLLKEIHTSGNVVFSPFSIAASLALIQQGAFGTTRRQLTKLLDMYPKNSLDVYGKFFNTLQKRRSTNVFKVASAIFAHNSPKDHFNIRKAFNSKCANFDTSVNFDANFDDVDSAANVINKWVEEKTNGLIQKLLTADSISENTRLVLANAVFFKGQWKFPFDPSKTHEGDFKLANGQLKRTHFMFRAGKYRAGTFRKFAGGATIVILPFENEQYSFIGILPETNSNLDTLVSGLNDTSLLKKLSTMDEKDVKITMPKFVIQKQFNLENVLSKMGLTDMFSNRCNISGIGNYNGVAPVISTAVHSAALIVDEKGTTAAASTGYGVTMLSAIDDTVYFQGDRPFLVLLWDQENSIPLFMARIEDPKT